MDEYIYYVCLCKKMSLLGWTLNFYKFCRWHVLVHKGMYVHLYMCMCTVCTNHPTRLDIMSCDDCAFSHTSIKENVLHVPTVTSDIIQVVTTSSSGTPPGILNIERYQQSIGNKTFLLSSLITYCTTHLLDSFHWTHAETSPCCRHKLCIMTWSVLKYQIHSEQFDWYTTVTQWDTLCMYMQ